MCLGCWYLKTFITNASMKMDLVTVSKLAGHLQINTTAKYYTKIDQQRQKDQLDKLEEIEGVKYKTKMQADTERR